MQPNASVQVLRVNGKPSSLQLPSSVELAVVETEPGVKGDTVSNVTKPATLETGAVVQVPMFVNVGDRLKVDPRERPLHLARLSRLAHDALARELGRRWPRRGSPAARVLERHGDEASSACSRAAGDRRRMQSGSQRRFGDS